MHDRANVNPPLIINRSINFVSEDTSSISSQQIGDSSAKEDDEDAIVEADGDPFVPDAAHRAKKKRRAANPTKVMENLLDVFQQKWENDKERNEAIHDEEKVVREEEKERANKIVNIIERNSQIMEQSMNNIVDVLQIIATKLS